MKYILTERERIASHRSYRFFAYLHEAMILPIIEREIERQSTTSVSPSNQN